MRDEWPSLPFESWKATYETLHRYCQIVGKIQLARTTRINHWWNVGFLLDARGLRTQPMRCAAGLFDISFDFVDHRWTAQTSAGRRASVPLEPRPVADFQADVFRALDSLGIEVRIDDRPVEMPGETLPFRYDREHASYDWAAAGRWFQILLLSQQVFEEFRARFVGKSSPVLFYWGSFDLAVTRYSGRPAPSRAEADVITQEAYSHEDSSVGLWPGTDALGGPLYYGYTAPAPKGYDAAPVRPAEARFDRDLGEFVLPYDVVRRSRNPRETLLEFLQSTYEAGANQAGWDRARLERRGAFPSAEEHAALH